MRCQLAKIRDDVAEPYPYMAPIAGRFIWLTNAPLLYDVEIYLPNGDCYQHDAVAMTPYLPQPGFTRVAIPNDALERLPVFRDVTPTSILDWYNNGGEPDPRSE